MTILEKLKTGSPIEVAEFLDKHFADSCPPKSPETCPATCVGCWARWLESPVDVPEKGGGLNST